MFWLFIKKKKEFLLDYWVFNTVLGRGSDIARLFLKLSFVRNIISLLIKRKFSGSRNPKLHGLKIVIETLNYFTLKLRLEEDAINWKVLKGRMGFGLTIMTVC